MSYYRAATVAGFLELLKSYDFDKITVAMLCEVAKISRRTFYRCFNGINEIVESIVYDDFIDPPNKLRSVLAMDSIKSATLLCTESVMGKVHERRDAYYKLLDYRGYYSLADTIAQMTFDFNMKTFCTYIKDPVELEFSSHIIAISQAMVVDWWIRKQKDVSPKQIAKLSVAWVFSHFRELEGDSAWERA